MDEAIAARSFLDVPPLERLESSGRPTGLGRWLADHLPQSNTPSAPAATNAQKVGVSVPAWILDHFQAQAALQLEFPDDFIRDERQTIEREFGNSLLRWFRPLFRQFAMARIHDRFATYPLATDKVKLEACLRLLERDRARLQNRAAAIPKSLDDVLLSAYPEVRAAEQLIKKLLDQIAESWRLEHEELARLDQATTEVLATYKIMPNAISGIGKARIAALNSVGVFTAADITPVNQPRALSALSNIRGASPLLEWQKLEDWRDAQRKRVHTPSPTAGNSGASAAIAARYTNARREMQRTLQARQQEANRIRSNILKSEQARLRQLLDELAGLERQIREAQARLQRYAKITPEHLLNKIISVPDAGN